MKTDVRLEHQLLAVETEHAVHAMLELTAPPAATASARLPLNLVLVIDRSGSMAGPKLETTKECAAFLVRRLGPTDSLSVVAYDDEVRLVSPLGALGDRQDVLRAIGGIQPGGQTNLSGGWLKGVEELKRAQAHGPRTVLLLTDGLANVGVVDPSSLVAMAGSARGEGIGTTTIGYGDGFNEDLLTGMADAGGGNAHYAGTTDEAPGIFASEFEGLMSVVAQNLSVEIRPSDQVKLLGVLNEYPSVPVPGGVQVQLGDAYADETRRVVFELHVPELSALGVAKVADIVVRYVSVGEQIAAHEVTVPVTVNLVSADDASASQADREVVEEIVVLKAARARDEARKAAESGDFERAKTVLGAMATELRAIAPGSAKARELLEDAEQLESHAMGMTALGFTPGAAKAMKYQSHSTRRGRRPPRRS